MGEDNMNKTMLIAPWYYERVVEKKGSQEKADKWILNRIKRNGYDSFKVVSYSE